MDYTRILLDISVFAFFGLLYYIFQRRRIIRHGLQEVFYILDSAIYRGHEFLDDKKNEEFYPKLNLYIENLEKIQIQEDLYELDELLNKIPKELPEEVKTDLEDVLKKIQFHLKPKR